MADRSKTIEKYLSDWELGGLDDGTLTVESSNGDGQLVIEIPYCGKSKEDAQFAMARLVLAAPDLLASLRDLRAIIHDDLTHARQEDHADAIKRADAAIALADKGVGQ